MKLHIRWISLVAAGLAVAGVIVLRAQAPQPEAVYDAIRTNDLARLRMLITTAADANRADDHANTPLIDAAAAGSPEALQYLISKGANVNVPNASGLSPLMLAATDLAKTRVLVDHGANVNATTKTGRSALFLAAMSSHSAAVVRLLLAKGADVKAVDVFKNTML